MSAFTYPGIVTGLSLLVYYYTLYQSGMARGRFGVQAPSHDGPEDYQRYVRAHLNTLEHLVLFVPSLWLFALAVDPFWAAGIGVFWPIGRLLYALGYYQAPSKRMLGLIISMPPIYIFVLGSRLAFAWTFTTANSKLSGLRGPLSCLRSISKTGSSRHWFQLGLLAESNDPCHQ